MTSTGTVIFARSSVKSVWEKATTPSWWAFAPPAIPWRHQFWMTASDGSAPGRLKP
jgi:hypothetical protein